MVYLKSIVAGVIASLLSVVLLIVGFLGWLYFKAWAAMRAEPAGQGGIGAVSASFPLPVGGIVVLMLTVFALGFWWQFRRASR